MKKLLSLVLGILVTLSALSFGGCAEKGPEKYTFYTPDGAPALAIAKFINDSDNLGFAKPVEYNVVAANAIGDAMHSGNADMMLIPINLASKLYDANVNDPYKMVSVVTHGNLYWMCGDTSQTFAELRGKVFGIIPQVPELTVRAIFTDIADDIVIGESPASDKFTFRRLSGGQIKTMLANGTLDNGILPEPLATQLVNETAGVKTWKQRSLNVYFDGNGYPQAVLMVKSSILQANPQLISALSQKIDQNVTWAKENVESAVSAVNGKLASGVVPSMSAQNITAKVITNCNIYWQGSTDAKQSVTDYVNRIFAVDADSARVVTDSFFA